jgi:hypothetical protein
MATKQDARNEHRNQEYHSIVKLTIVLKFVYSMTGLLLGLSCILGGIFLFFSGVSGSTNWTAKILGAESTINDAAPGTVLFIAGIFLVLITRFRFKGDFHNNGAMRSLHLLSPD